MISKYRLIGTFCTLNNKTTKAKKWVCDCKIVTTPVVVIPHKLNFEHWAARFQQFNQIGHRNSIGQNIRSAHRNIVIRIWSDSIQLLRWSWEVCLLWVLVKLASKWSEALFQRKSPQGFVCLLYALIPSSSKLFFSPTSSVAFPCILSQHPTDFQIWKNHLMSGGRML